MPVPRSVRIGFFLVLLLIPWVLVSWLFWRLFYIPTNGLVDVLASYLPILGFLAAILVRFLNQLLRDELNPNIGLANAETVPKCSRWIAVALVFGGTALIAVWWGWVSTRSILP